MITQATVCHPPVSGMTWISDDPWGYVTFHHGRWGWSSRWGWYWIPGVFYSPAWVAWNWSGGYCGWAPLGYWNAPCHWGYGAWGGGYCWKAASIAFRIPSVGMKKTFQRRSRPSL